MENLFWKCDLSHGERFPAGNFMFMEFHKVFKISKFYLYIAFWPTSLLYVTRSSSWNARLIEVSGIFLWFLANDCLCNKTRIAFLDIRASVGHRFVLRSNWVCIVRSYNVFESETHDVINQSEVTHQGEVMQNKTFVIPEDN